jgi:hypothetical protein
MPDKVSAAKFHTLAELEKLSEAELTAMWEVVPTDRQRLYKAMYDRELRKEGVTGAVGSDALEKLVLLSLLKQYEETALVPAGEVWVYTPRFVQERARQNELLVEPDPTTREGRKTPPVPILLAGGAVFLCMIFFLLVRGRGGKAVALAGTITATHTLTPVHSPTPTPLALENQDQVINGGSGDRVIAYPVNLRIQIAGSSEPRVFVVQRRVVRTAEWDFDNNPDTASFVTGMSVRPIIGIPWSEENAALFKNISSGTQFTLQMNTGALLRYDFVSTAQVTRSDTSVLRQVGPGLVLILIGERDVDNQLTATRMLVTAAYAADQELSREGVLMNTIAQSMPTSTPTAMPTPVDRIDVQMVSVTSHAPTKSLTVSLRIFNARQSSITIGPDALWVALGYSPRPPGPRIPAEGLTPFGLLPGQAVNLTVHFPWSGEPFATVGTEIGNDGTYQFAVQLAKSVD